jgi:hypothetical protein
VGRGSGTALRYPLVTGLEPDPAILPHVTRRDNQRERDPAMTTLPNIQSPLDQLDRELHELTREHGHVIDLDEFRRHLDIADQRPTPQPADPADTPSQPHTESQLTHELNLAFTELGAAAFALAHHGNTTDRRLIPHVQHIHDLYTHLDAITHAA